MAVSMVSLSFLFNLQPENLQKNWLREFYQVRNTCDSVFLPRNCLCEKPLNFGEITLVCTACWLLLAQHPWLQASQFLLRALFTPPPSGQDSGDRAVVSALSERGGR